MFGLIAPVVIGLLAGYVHGGSLKGWERLRVIWWPVAAGALLIQLALFNPPLDRQGWLLGPGPWLWILSLAAILLVLLRNARAGTHGRILLLGALGIALNLAVVVANGGQMPRSATARTTAARVTLSSDANRLRNVQPLTSETRLAWLADVLPEPSWLPRANVLSIGDVLLALSLGGWSYAVTRGERRGSASVRPLTV